MTKTYQIATIPGDGIGIEVTAAATKVLSTLASSAGYLNFIFTNFDWSTETYKHTGYYIPPGGIDQLKKYDAVYFGAVGCPGEHNSPPNLLRFVNLSSSQTDVNTSDVPDHVSLWGLMLPLRTSMCQYVNVRPTRILKGINSPLNTCKEDSLDWLIVRENSEGEYAGHGGETHAAFGNAVATDVSIFTQSGIERVMRFAFETARSRRKKLTMVTKSNAQRHGMVLWDRIFHDIRKDYTDIDSDSMLVDAMTVRMVMRPESLDTIVATNLHGDILSDLAAALSGSVGVAPSSNLDPTRNYPSMFEPIHGSAPDIAGKGIANPIGALWTAVEMVAWIGEREASTKLMEAIENVTGRGVRTSDLGGSSSTDEVVDAICTELALLNKK